MDKLILQKLQFLLATKPLVIIAIDGRGGSGKTTITSKIQTELGISVQIVHMDDFYYPSSKRTKLATQFDYNFDWQRLELQVLKPLTNGFNSNFKKYNWNKDKLDGSNKIIPTGLIIIEGCYCLQQNLQKYYDLKIWVETDKKTAFQRGLNRDLILKNSLDLNQKIASWHEWQRLEDIYISKTDPTSTANFVINT